MIELTERQLLDHLNHNSQGGQAESSLPELIYLFIYTPFCGTCGAARKMLDILQQMRPELPLYAVNVNFLPQLVQAWEITSVPCLMKLHGGQSDDRLYAMQSIDNLYRFLVQEQTKQ